MLTSSGRDKSENDFMDSKKNYGENDKKTCAGSVSINAQRP